MKKHLAKHRLIGIDTNIFVYYLNRNSSFYSIADQILRTILNQESQLVTSALTTTELLSFKAPEATISKLEDELFLIPSLSIREVTQEIAKKAAKIRRIYGFQLVDAIQLATAQSANAQVFISNDIRLKQYKPLKVLLLTELRTE